MMLRDPRVSTSQADASIQLAAIPTAPSAGRRFVKAVLKIRGVPEFEDLALLCTSELITNAVNATDGHVVLCTAITQQQIRIEVWDSSAEMPAPRATDVDDERGRGLLLVGAVSDRWGSELLVSTHERGPCKVTWCEWDRVA